MNANALLSRDGADISRKKVNALGADSVKQR